MSKEIGERFKTFRDYFNLSQKQFADRIGTLQRNVSRYETGASIPDEIMGKLADLGVNLHWLLTGNGPMILSETMPSNEGGGALIMAHRSSSNEVPIDLTKVVAFKFLKGRPDPVETDEEDPLGVISLPFYEQPAAAGPGQPPTQIQQSDTFFPVMQSLLGHHKPSTSGITRVVGDSMSDIYLFNGDYVLFDRAETGGDGIFVITMFGETRVKRLHRRLADKHIIITSENAKRYPDAEEVDVEVLERGDLIIHGRVFGWLHKHPY